MIIDTFPAYSIVKDTLEFNPGDVFAIGYDTDRHGRLYNFFKLGSAEDYALRYGDDPVKTVEDAKARGEELYWANPMGVMLSARKEPHKYYRAVAHGDLITFKGKTFQVIAARNNNVKLVEVQ